MTSAKPRPLQLTWYQDAKTAVEIRPAPQERDWMEQTGDRFAYRCLPLNIANAHAWEILCPTGFQAVWSGRSGKDAISIYYDGKDGPRPAVSHFGSGILTFHVPGLLRTETGYDLWVSGPINRPKAHIQALTGVIEADWSTFSFTMNWKFTTSNRTVRFEAGEPFCAFFPIPRGLIERFEPVILNGEEEPELYAEHLQRREERKKFLRELDIEGSQARRQRWQRDYFRGPGNPLDPPHRTKLRLAPFRRR